jgi:hypothetical protein
VSTIIMRSALVAWGQTPAPELHSIVQEHAGAPRQVVTWSEVMERRRQHQAETLRRKRYVAPWRAFKCWVAYFDQDLFGGWHAFMENIRTRVDRDRPLLIRPLMKLFPLVLDLGTNGVWSQWKIEFAKSHQRGTQHGHARGVAYLWWNNWDTPRLLGNRPAPAANREAVP